MLSSKQSSAPMRFLPRKLQRGSTTKAGVRNRQHCANRHFPEINGDQNMSDSRTRILLAEDSRFLRKATELILVKAGYEVITAGDGDEAYALAHAKQPHLIILDMMMPKRDGLSTLRSLKEDSSTCDIPVVVLTGLSQHNEDRLLRAGALAYYEKSKLIPE